jgi:DNA-binding PadR family transcriptional regulator
MHFPFHRCGRETEGRRFMHGFGRHPGHHGRHRHGGRGGRFFEQGDLRLVILHLIAEKPRHGYEIIKAIEEQMAGAYSPSPGVIYPTLTLLEELGQIATAEAEGSRKLYAITPEGERVLTENRATVQAILGRMAAAAGERPAGSALQVMRAMHNLKLALRLRLARGSLTEEQLHRIVAAIDAAAVQVERE